MSEKKQVKKMSTSKTSAKPTAKKTLDVKAAVRSAVKGAVAKIEKRMASVTERKITKPAAKSPAKSVVAKAVEKPVVKSVKKEAAKPITNKVAAKPAAKSPAKSVATKKVSKAPVDASQHSFSPEYLVLMQRDPNWMHAFWDVSEKRLADAMLGGSKLVLRLYDVSSDLTVRKAKNRKFRDVEIPREAKSWYIQNQGSYACSASIGSVDQSGNFSPFVNSSSLQTFSFDGVSAETDNAFFKASIGSAGIGGFGSSGLTSPSANSWFERLASSSESLSSGSLSSGALVGSSVDSVNYGKDFFLWVKTRLIVYGGTRPDAHLQVRGESFPLNVDGTFSLEMDLPDSTQVIPVFATDKDGDFPTTIVPIVVKRTE